MQRVYAATSYFILGYTIIVAIITSLYFLPSSLKTSIGMVMAAIVFVDMSYRYFRRTMSIGEPVKVSSVFSLMAYWAFLSLALDILIMVVILPLVATGSVNLLFFSQQPSIYWFQFPMFFVFGFVSQAIYNRVIEITTSQVDQA